MGWKDHCKTVHGARTFPHLRDVSAWMLAPWDLRLALACILMNMLKFSQQSPY